VAASQEMAPRGCLCLSSRSESQKTPLRVALRRKGAPGQDGQHINSAPSWECRGEDVPRVNCSDIAYKIQVIITDAITARTYAVLFAVWQSLPVYDVSGCTAVPKKAARALPLGPAASSAKQAPWAWALPGPAAPLG
jgi:hypothetical protein